MINEIAWMGTQASTYDEWIELYNTTDRDIDLTGWKLSDGGDIDITLSGIIPAKGFFLLERTADDTVSDISADQVYGNDGPSWALKNTGESLLLKDPVENVIDTANGNGGVWPAGDNTTKSTMERIDPLAPDSDANWATNDGVHRNGLDAEGNSINGTPKARNSVTNTPPIADAGPDQTVNIGATVQLDGSGSSDPDGDPLSYSWSFIARPSGSAAALSDPHIVDPAFVADVAGDYSLELVVDDGRGGTDSDQVRITANAPPQADFTFAPAKPTTQDIVQFTDRSTDSDGTVVSWTWDFGDGETSNKRNPIHQYTDDGSYTVTLMVTDDDGATGSVSHEVVVSNVAPSADFSFAPAEPTTQDTVQFTDKSTDPDGAVVSWSWDFRDGATSNERNPTHRYADDGTYTVTLTVTDDDAASATVSREVVVKNLPPVACFTYTPDSPTTQDNLLFTECSTDVDGTVVSWTWDFGDGATSSERDPTHRYDDDGTYTVTLMVADDDGTTGRVSHEVVVANVGPTADFTFAPEHPLALELVQFKDQSTDEDGAIVLWHWDFGDGESSSLQNPAHAYAQGGGYTVALTVEDDDGERDTVMKEIEVASCANYITLAPQPLKEGGIFWLCLPENLAAATIKFFDVDGRELVSIPLDLTADRYPDTGRWIPKDAQGRLLGTGLYLYLVEMVHADGTVTYSPIQKMVIQR